MRTQADQRRVCEQKGREQAFEPETETARVKVSAPVCEQPIVSASPSECKRRTVKRHAVSVIVVRLGFAVVVQTMCEGECE